MIYLDNTNGYSQRLFIPREGSELEATGSSFNLQEKHYVINRNGETVIHPDAEYVGISGGTITVNVHGSGSTYGEGYDDGFNDGFSSGYTSGHTSGYTEGKEAQKALLASTSVTENGIYIRENGWNQITVEVPTGETYPRSNVTVGISSNDYDGLANMPVQLYEWGQSYSAFTPTSAVTSLTATYNPGVEYAVKFVVPEMYQCSSGRYINYESDTLWGRDVNLEFQVNKYTGVVSSVFLYTRNGSGTTFNDTDMLGYMYIGSTAQYTGPSYIKYDADEDRWVLDYYGNLVSGFTTMNGTTLRDDIVKIELPEYVTRVDGFHDCKYLTSFHGDGITDIGNGMAAFDNTAAFSDCTVLTDFSSSVPVVTVASRAFQNCWSLSGFTFESLEEIGHSAFINCNSLTTVNLDSIKVIGYQAFSDCTGLTNVSIGTACTNVDGAAFAGCSALTGVTVYATTAPTIGIMVFSGVPETGTLYIPQGADYSYWIAALPSGWTVEDIL